MRIFLLTLIWLVMSACSLTAPCLSPKSIRSDQHKDALQAGVRTAVVRLRKGEAHGLGHVYRTVSRGFIQAAQNKSRRVKATNGWPNIY